MSSELKGKAFDWNILKRIFVFVKPYKKYFYFTVFVALILSALSPLRPWLTQQALDKYIAKGDMSGLLNITLIMLGVLLTQTLFQFLYTTLTNRLGQEVILQMRKSLFERLIYFSNTYFDKTPVGITITRLVNDMETVADIFSDGLILIISDLLQVVVIVIVMFYIDVKLAVISLITIPVLMIATRIFQTKIRTTFNDVRVQVARLNEFVQEHLTAMRIVQIFNREKAEMKKFETINAAHRDANIDSIWYYSIFFPVVEVLSATSIGLIVWYGGGAAVKGTVSLGILVAFIQYINQLFRPIRELADKFNTLQMGMVSSERIFKLLDERNVEDNYGVKPAEGISGKIEFKNVWFAYKEDEWVLRDVSFTINAGESVAIVGPTGAGKTTIISLVNRLYEIQKGQILIDDVDIREYDIHGLRKKIGVVLQDVFLFSDTISKNISLYEPGINDIEVKNVLKQIGAAEFIERLPGSYDYNPGERGATLSTGQRQLISFARVLAHNPRIIILDEATSSIDSDLEKLIVKATELATGSRTSIIIAHRLATIKKANTIFVMERGQIMEQGTHEQLLQQSGIYSNLYHIQFAKELNVVD